MKNLRYRFITDFSGTMEVVKLKFNTHMDNGLMYPVYRIQGQGPITLGVASFDRFYNLLLIKIFVIDFSGTMKVETWYTHGQWADE